MIGQLGADAFAEPLLMSLQNAGAGTTRIGRAEGSTGAASISVLPNGENAIVISPGANAKVTPDFALSSLQDLQPEDLVLLQLEIPIATVRAVLEHASARRATTLLDPAPAQSLPRELLANVGFLTPNESEACLLLNRSGSSIRDTGEAAEIATELRTLGPKSVILKLGSLGCFIADDAFFGLVPGFTVEAIDTTAAGDTFNGAFAVAISEGADIREAASFANAAAALSVTRLGAQSSIPTRSEVTAFLDNKELQAACS
jgi:ribokinase